MRWLLNVLATSMALTAIPTFVSAALPDPPRDWIDWPAKADPAAPGEMNAAALLDKPAGKTGSVVVRDGHFFTGDKRLRLWGVNVCFSGAFPTHAQADATALRLAAYGINCVRFHHMDNQPFPNGIWLDRHLEKMSPEALDRLDYFIAALKAQGIYADLNLHVSRWWSKTHDWENADQLPGYDKMIDLIHPELIEAQRQYARDLTGHVNAYTHNRYADEPAVAIMEINNEDSLFLWGGEATLEKLPRPYSELLDQLWNQWLIRKYPTRDLLRTAWAAGAHPLGDNVLKDTAFETLAGPANVRAWVTEADDRAAAMTAAADKAVDRADAGAPAVRLNIAAVDGTTWHLQFHQPGITVRKGVFYTVSFRAKSDVPGPIDVCITMAHEPWHGLGLAAAAVLDTQYKDYRFGFVAADDDKNARLSFIVGQKVRTIDLSKIELCPGGQTGLADDEDAMQKNVRRHGTGDGMGGGGAETPARSADWYDFLQQTDQKFFVDMLQYLKQDLRVHCPITGSIGFGPLSTLSQSKMDYVDAHAYWDHPNFPHRPWDAKDWLINNKPMADQPSGATLWGLAETRVAGKPFTVTEYNHAAPNEWEAECIPMIASYAALQDWDGVFLFAYSHDSGRDKSIMNSFFDIEGNAMKMPFMPSGARIFLGQAVAPLRNAKMLHPKKADMLATASRYYYSTGPFVRDVLGVTWTTAMTRRLSLSFDSADVVEPAALAQDDRITWTGGLPDAGTGRYTVNDPHASVFAGFTGSTPIVLGPVKIDGCKAPFIAAMLVPSDPTQTLESADRLLLTIIARAENTGMKWDDSRRTVGDQWGRAPVRLEAIRANISILSQQGYSIYPLDPQGKRREKIETISEPGRTIFDAGAGETMWFELVKE